MKTEALLPSEVTQQYTYGCNIIQLKTVLTFLVYLKMFYA